MRSIPLLLCVAATAVSALARAAMAEDHSTIQAKTNLDGIRVVGYSALKRTEIVGVIGQPTTITFPSDEDVYRVVQSNKLTKDGLTDAGWQAPDPKEIEKAPLGNVLPLWPVSPGESIMTVTTKTPQGTQKVYAFRLMAVPTSADPQRDYTYNLIFKGGQRSAVAAAPTTTGNDDPLPVRRVASVSKRRRAQKEAEEAQAEAEAEERLRVDSFNRVGGCHYLAQGKHPNPLEPMCPLDNGIWTLFRFPGLSPKPTIYVINDDGSWRLARQHGSGDFVVVEEIDKHFRLLLTPDILDVWNTAYNPAGQPTGTGTLSPSVQRDVIPAGQQPAHTTLPLTQPAAAPAEPAPTQANNIIPAAATK